MTSKPDTLVIEAVQRTAVGKSYSAKLRRAGKIPGIIIQNGKTTAIELESKLIPKAFLTMDRKFHLKLGGQTIPVAIHELQIHPLKRHPIHVDLVST